MPASSAGEMDGSAGRRFTLTCHSRTKETV